MFALTRNDRRPRILRLTIALVAGLVLLGACSSDDDSDSADTGETPAAENGAEGDDGTEASDGGADMDADVTVVAEDIDFPTTEFTASAGEVTIAYVNEGSIRHTLAIEGVDDWSTLEVASNGETAAGTIELEPGDYTLFCDVPGHRSAGMEGTLTVT